MIDSEPEIFEKVKKYEFAKKKSSKTSDKADTISEPIIQGKPRIDNQLHCDNLPREICDNLLQRHFLICNRIIAAMFEIH